MVDGVPRVEVGDFAITGGSGGSVTSSCVKIGFGSWAGGKDEVLMSVKTPPGLTGNM